MFIILGADGKEYGPVKARIVHEWLAEGRASLETKARRSDSSTWLTLADFPEFADPRNGSAAPPVLAETAPAAAPAARPLSASPMTATSSLRVSAPLASHLLRLTGAIVDGLLKVVCFLPTALPLYRFIDEQNRTGNPLSFQETFTATNALLSEHLPKSLPFLIALLLVQMTLITLRGQSIGKLLVGTRIVRHDTGERAGFIPAFALRSVLPWLVQQIPLVGVIFLVVDALFIFRADRRCVHDLFAGTKVVVAQPPQD